MGSADWRTDALIWCIYSFNNQQFEAFPLICSADVQILLPAELLPCLLFNTVGNKQKQIMWNGLNLLYPSAPPPSYIFKNRSILLSMPDSTSCSSLGGCNHFSETRRAPRWDGEQHSDQRSDPFHRKLKTETFRMKARTSWSLKTSDC